MSVQWFPGHMAKAKRLIGDNLKLIDIVIEVLDARAPYASANPLLRNLTWNKPRLVLLNKDDLADRRATELWMAEFRRDGHSIPLRVSGKQGKGLKAIPGCCHNLVGNATWLSRRPVRALIAGIPNVGKSTIINGLSLKNKAKTGATPGLTRNLQRVPINSQLELFDTPGLLWHKFKDPLTGMVLAALGSVKETILPNEDFIDRLLSYLDWRYPKALAARYGLNDEIRRPSTLTEMVGRKRGCLRAGGELDHQRICQMVLRDMREGKLGCVSLEWPDGLGWAATHDENRQES